MGEGNVSVSGRWIRHVTGSDDSLRRVPSLRPSVRPPARPSVCLPRSGSNTRSVFLCCGCQFPLRIAFLPASLNLGRLFFSHKSVSALRIWAEFGVALASCCKQFRNPAFSGVLFFRVSEFLGPVFLSFSENIVNMSMNTQAQMQYAHLNSAGASLMQSQYHHQPQLPIIAVALEASQPAQVGTQAQGQSPEAVAYPAALAQQQQLGYQHLQQQHQQQLQMFWQGQMREIEQSWLFCRPGLQQLQSIPTIESFFVLNL